MSTPKSLNFLVNYQTIMYGQIISIIKNGFQILNSNLIFNFKNEKRNSNIISIIKFENENRFLKIKFKFHFLKLFQ
jgi:uncharacterized protein YegL